MFLIRRITEPRLAARVCASFGLPEGQGFAYGAFKDDEVLATAAFLSEKGGEVVFCGVDTGRRMDIGLVDGILRAALAAQRKHGAKTARFGAALPEELKKGLGKLGYPRDGAIALSDLFAKKC